MQEKCYQYWPSERSVRYDTFVVEPITEYNMPQYILREFKVTDTIDNGSRTVRQFQFTDWPEQGVPKSAEGFIDFIGQVHKTKEQFGQEGPITVHCRYTIILTLNSWFTLIQNVTFWNKHLVRLKHYFLFKCFYFKFYYTANILCISNSWWKYFYKNQDKTEIQISKLACQIER